MDMVLRRYTPPTCTLEITAKSSLLAWWASRSARQSLQFELHFDAPQLPEEQRIRVRGDRAELQALRAAVNAYVQDFLASTSEQIADLNLTNWQESDKEMRDDNEQLPSEENIPSRAVAAAPPQNLPGVWRERTHVPEFPVAAALPAPVEEAEQEETTDDFPGESAPESSTEASDRDTLGIYLQPKGLLWHELFLGSLATEESGSAVQLDVLQLFDLATALDSYEADEKSLAKQTNWFKQSPVWASAALVLLTVGVTAGAIELLDRKNNVKTATQTAKVQPSNPPQQQIPAAVPSNPPQQQIAIAPAPTAEPTAPEPAAPTPPPQPVAQNTPLPKLPRIDPPVAAPNFNPLQIPTPPRPPATGAIPAPTRSPIALAPAPQNNNPPIAESPTSRIYIPAAPPTIVPSIPPKPNSELPIISIPPNSLPDTAQSPNPPSTPILVQPSPDSETAPAPTTPPLAAKIPVVTPAPSKPPVAAKTPETAPAPAPSIEPNTDPPPLLPRIEGLPDGTSQADETSSVQSKLPEISQPEPTQTPIPVETPAQTATAPVSEPISHLEEAKNYFQERWKPQSELTKPLEYTLSLNPDGSIQQITPRGETSERYLDRTGMPLRNEPFVSKLPPGETLKIRLFLAPDGKVLTFEER